MVATEKAKNPKKSSAKLMDVAKPGKSAPAATSRPVIVGHKAMLHDPMMSKGTSGDTPPLDDSAGHKITVTRSSSKVVKPLSAQPSSKEDEPDDSSPEPEVSAQEATPESTEETSAEPEKALEEAAPAEEAVEEPAEEDTPEPTPDEQSKEADSPSTSSSRPKTSTKGATDAASSEPTKGEDAAVVDAVAEQAGSKKKEKPLSEEEVKKREAIDKLIADKKYFVPIGQVTKKRRARWSVVILVLLLALVGGYVAVDAQLIANNLALPYEFFKEDDETKQPQASTDNTATPDSPDTTPKPTAPTEAYTGQVIEPVNKGFSIKIPDGWKVQTIKGSGMLFVLASSDLEYISGTKPTVKTSTTSNGDATLSFVVNQFGSDEPYQLLDGDEQETSITVNGVKGTRYYKQYPVEKPKTVGPLPGQKQYTYVFKKGDKTTYVGYAILQKNEFTGASVKQNDENRLTLIEKVVKTLVIK